VNQGKMLFEDWLMRRGMIRAAGGIEGGGDFEPE
jgi:hypothetical protein